MKTIIKIILLLVVITPLYSNAQLVVSTNSDWVRYCYLEVEGYHTSHRNGISDLPKFRSLNDLLRFFNLKNYKSGWTFSTSNGKCYIKTEDSNIGIKDNGNVSNIYRHNCILKDPYGYDPYDLGWNNKGYIVVFVEPYQTLNNQSVVVAVVMKSDSGCYNFFGEWDAFYFSK